MSKPPPPPRPPPPRSLSEEGQEPLYLEVLPEETRYPVKPRNPRPTCPSPPPPPTLTASPAGHKTLLLMQTSTGGPLCGSDTQDRDSESSLEKPLDTQYRHPCPERPPPPNFTKNREGHKPIAPIQTSTWGPSKSCDTHYKDSKTSPTAFDTEYYNSKTAPAGFDTDYYESKLPPAGFATEYYNSKTAPAGFATEYYDSKTAPASFDTDYYESKLPPAGFATEYYDSKTAPAGFDTDYYESKLPPAGFATEYYNSKTAPAGIDNGNKDGKTPQAGFDNLYEDIDTIDACNTQYEDSLKHSGSFITDPVKSLTFLATRGKAVHDFFAKRPQPPVPQSNSEPLYVELIGSTDVKKKDSEECKPEDIELLMAWWRTVEDWDNMPMDLELNEQEEMRLFTLTAYRIKMGLRLFNCLLSKHRASLQNHITELNTTVDNMEDLHKWGKTATKAGSTTVALGGGAVIAGLALAPFTGGTSLLVAAVGVSVAAAGGLTAGGSAAHNKANKTQDRKRVEKIVLDYSNEISEIERCLNFVCVGMEWLGQQDTSRLRVSDEETVAVARLAKVADGKNSSIQTAFQSLEILQKFSLDMNDLPTDEKSQKVTKITEAKFSEKIHSLAQQLQDGLDNLIRIQEKLSLVGTTTGVYEPRYV